MNESNCPVCYTPLEVRDVAPCFDCGAFEHEIEHALAGKHKYAEWLLLGEIKLVLCDFCRVDFYSYSDPSYFGFPSRQRFKIALDQLEFVRGVEVYTRKDKYCPNCGSRLAWLEFVEQIRSLNEQSTGTETRE
jgi:hypothetical protein